MDEIIADIQQEEIGAIKITDDVVSIIAGLAAIEVEGVASMSGGFAGGIAEALGMKNLSKGVKVEVTEKEAIINLFIIVEYGVRIPEVAWNIQNNVKQTVESMTGLIVTEVNIHVQGINLTKESKKASSQKTDEQKIDGELEALDE
jgi:uncharacterized alkaline shock family protein YloU